MTTTLRSESTKSLSKKYIISYQTIEMMYNTDFIKTGSIVWVSSSNCGSKNGYIGRISRRDKDIAYITNLSTGTANIERVSDLIETVPAPIDEKNIISDWIHEELLENCSQNGNEYLGWFKDKYPVFGKVCKDGSLTLKPIDSSIIPSIQESIEHLFSAEKEVCVLFKNIPELLVKFYFIINR